MIVNNIELGESKKPYIIAELSANHGGSILEQKAYLRLQNAVFQQ